MTSSLVSIFTCAYIKFISIMAIQEIEVKDPDVEPDAFQTMLHFIYKIYKNVLFTDDSVLAVLYVGKNY